MVTKSFTRIIQKLFNPDFYALNARRKRAVSDCLRMKTGK